TLQRWVAAQPVAAVVERAGLLDIPAAALGEAAATAPRIRPLGPKAPTAPKAPEPLNTGLLVADLSSMWAGPLCGHLLARSGATVVKVESPSRPDGTRAGERGFFDWINTGKLSYCVDFDRQVNELRALLAVADVVIEGSRPAALARRGLGPKDIEPRAGRIWLRIAGHDGCPGRPAFGDDAAVPPGVRRRRRGGRRPGRRQRRQPGVLLAAAQAVNESRGRGGGELIEVSLAAVAASYAALPTIPNCDHPAPAPTIPPAAKPASELGADNDAVRRLIAERRCLPC
ncbi:CoA transferase, partial [Mycobacterium conspicuum]|uniref:CoA transferase n=1 Tax=Mycobacterium conspicuum TaxID=44010 RepID=UPI003556A177